MIMRIWFLKNTKTYNITYTRSPYNTNWENWWISNWVTTFISKDEWNEETNSDKIIEKSNTDINNSAYYQWRKLRNLVNSNVSNTANLDNFYPTSLKNKSWIWYSIIDSNHWIVRSLY